MSSGFCRNSPDAAFSSGPSSAPSVPVRAACFSSCGNCFYRSLSPPSRHGEGDIPYSGGGVLSNGSSPDDGNHGEVAHAESTTITMVVDVIRTGST